MEIYTSYFDNIKTLEDNNIVPVSICCYPPRDLNLHNYSLFAPSRDILSNCRGSITLYKQRFTREILNMLSKDDVDNFLKELKTNFEGKDIALCCYEKPNEFCHRHLVAEYLNQNFGLHITEYINSKKQQNSLF